MVDRIEGARRTHFVSLAVRLVSPRRGLAASRYYVVYPRAAAVEMWTTFETLDDETRSIRNLNAYDLNVLAGPVQFINGLDAAETDGGAFARRERDLADGESLELAFSTLSSLASLPYFTVADGRQRLFSGLIWSGTWILNVRRFGDTLDASFTLPSMSALVRPGKPVEGPHAFIGAAPDLPGADTAAVSAFLRQSRARRAFPALATFNTWFVHGINIDEESVQREIDVAARLGLEPYQLDADEPMRDAVDMPLLARSRMPGVVGVATDLWELNERDFNLLNQEIELAKRLRQFQAEAVTYALTPQRSSSGNWWEIIQQVVPDGRLIVVFAVNGPGAGPTRVGLRGVRPDLVYEVRSADRGPVRRYSGGELVADGLTIEEAPESAAQVLVLEAGSSGVASRQAIFLRRPR